MTEDKKAHPLRRSRRRGKRGGKKRREQVTLAIAPPAPAAVQSLRARLAQMRKQTNG